MRIFRIAAISLGILLTLLVLAVAALLLFVDPNHYRGDIERIVKERTGRDLTLGGRLELKIFPWVALSAHDLRLSNRTGYGDEPFAAVRSASIGVKLIPLLSGRLQMSKIALGGVTLHLARRGDDNNWKDLGESEASATTATRPGSASSRYLSIEGVDLDGSSLVYRDESRGSVMEFSDIELHTGRLQSGPDKTVLGKLRLQGVYLSHRTSEAATAGVGARKALTQHKPMAFSLSTAGLVLDNAARSLAPTEVDVKLGDSSLRLSVRGEKMSADRVVIGSVTMPETSLRKLLLAVGIEPPVTRDAQALSKMALQTNFRLNKQQLQLSALQLTLDGTHIGGRVSVEDLNTQALGFDLSVDAVNLDSYRAPEPKTPAKAMPVAAKTPPRRPTPLPLDSLRSLNIHGTLRAGSVTIANLLFTNLTVPVSAKGGHIRLGPTQGRLYGGACNGEIALDAGPSTLELSVNEHAQGMDMGAWMKAVTNSTRVSGRADVNVALKSSGATDDALIQSLNGKIDANVKQGAVNGVDIVYELQRVNAVLNKQVPPQRTGPARTAFSVLQTNATLDKGVLHVDDMRMETAFLKVRGRGTLDTLTEAINYQLVASVNKLQPSGNPAAGAGGGFDALKSVDVPLIVTGTLSSPTVRPDIEALVRGKLRQEVQQRAGELVKKKLGDQLQGLFGR